MADNLRIGGGRTQFPDTGAAPTAAGDVQRRGADLMFHNGTQAVVIETQNHKDKPYGYAGLDQWGQLKVGTSLQPGQIIDVFINSSANLNPSKLASGPEGYVLAITGGVPTWANPSTLVDKELRSSVASLDGRVEDLEGSTAALDFRLMAEESSLDAVDARVGELEGSTAALDAATLKKADLDGVGELLVGSSNAPYALPPGTEEQVLTMIGGVPGWADTQVVISSHNSMAGLQGGQSEEFFHLTAVEHRRWLNSQVVSSVTSSLNLVEDDACKTYTNENATGGPSSRPITLPDPAPGLVFSFFVENSNGLRIQAPAGATIALGETESVVGGFVESNLRGDHARLRAINADTWMAEAVIGLWSIDA